MHDRGGVKTYVFDSVRGFAAMLNCVKDIEGDLVISFSVVYDLSPNENTLLLRTILGYLHLDLVSSGRSIIVRGGESNNECRELLVEITRK